MSKGESRCAAPNCGRAETVRHPLIEPFPDCACSFHRDCLISTKNKRAFICPVCNPTYDSETSGLLGNSRLDTAITRNTICSDIWDEYDIIYLSDEYGWDKWEFLKRDMDKRAFGHKLDNGYKFAPVDQMLALDMDANFIMEHFPDIDFKDVSASYKWRKEELEKLGFTESDLCVFLEGFDTLKVMLGYEKQ